jgi:WD40 repeat protein
VVASVGRTIEIYTVDSAVWSREDQGTQADSIERVHVCSSLNQGFSLSSNLSLTEWDLSTGERVDEVIHDKIPRSNMAIGPVAFARNGRLVASPTKQYVLKQWDLDSGVCRKVGDYDWDYVNAITVLVDTADIAVGSGDVIRLWNVELNRCIGTLTGHTDCVSALAPLGNRRLISGSWDQTVRVWALQTLTCEHTLVGHTERVTMVAQGHDENCVVSSSKSEVRVWDLQTGQVRHVFEAAGEAIVSQNGQRAAFPSSDRSIDVLDVSTGRLVAQCVTELESPLPVAFSDDGNRLTVASSKRSARTTFEVWRLSKAGGATLLWRSDGAPASSRLDRRSTVLWVTERDEAIEVWDINCGRLLHTLHGHAVHSLALAKNQRIVVFGSEDHALRIWDLDGDGADRRRMLDGHSDEISAVALDADGKRAVTGSKSGLVKIWNLRTGACQQTLSLHRDSISAIAITPDGGEVFTGSADKTITRLSLAGPERVDTYGLFSGEITHLLLDAEGYRLLIGLYDEGVVVKNLVDGSSLALDVQGDFLKTAAFTPDRDGIVTVARVESELHTITTWDARTGRIVGKIKTDFNVTAIVVSSDSRYVAAAGSGQSEFVSGDEIFKVWELKNGLEVAAFRGDASAACIACSESGVYVVGDWHGGVHLLSLG